MSTTFQTTRHGAAHNLRTKHMLNDREHEPMALVDTAIASFRNPSWSDAQLKALQTYYCWIRSWQGPAEGNQPIRDLLPLFSDMFFLGMLDRVEFFW